MCSENVTFIHDVAGPVTDGEVGFTRGGVQCSADALCATLEVARDGCFLCQHCIYAEVVAPAIYHCAPKGAPAPCCAALPVSARCLAL